MAWLPEVAVQSTFMSAGLHLGLILNIPLSTGHYDGPLDKHTGWPHLATIASASATAALLYTLKDRTRMEMFRQPVLLLAASIAFLLSGLPFFYDTDGVFWIIGAHYLAAISHGIVYVAALSYLNYRVSSRCRAARLSLCHFWYLLGCAATIQMCSAARNWEIDYGIALCFSSGLSCIMLITNEVFQYFKVYNYKCSLDEPLDIVNQQALLLYDRKEIIDMLRANSAQFPEGYSMLVTEVKRRWKLRSLLILLKLHAVMLFAPPMAALMRQGSASHLVTAAWAMPVGAILLVLISLLVNVRKSYLLFNALQMISIIATMIVVSTAEENFLYPLFLYYVFLSMIFPVGDLGLMDTTDFALTEVHLCVGLAIEKSFLMLMQFGIRYAWDLVLLPVVSQSIHAYGAGFFAYSLMMLVLVWYIYPYTHSKSLYTIHKEMLGINMIKRADQEPITVLPKIQYPYNSATGTYDFPGDKRRDVLTRNLSRSPTTPPAGGGSSGAPVFVGGMNNQFDRDFQRMSPAFILPRAIIGGAVFSTFAFNM